MRLWHLPVVAMQGVRVRRTTPVLPPAGGATSGRVGPAGERALQLGVLGESTAAGCGVATHEEGIAAALAGELAARSGRPVEWTVAGEFGATVRRIRHRILGPFLDEAPGRLDVAVLLAGVNDVLTRSNPSQWRSDLEAVVDRLAASSGLVLVTGVPPFGEFPSLPRTLASYLDERGRALDAMTEEVCRSRDDVVWLPSHGLLTGTPDMFAVDGFHPSGVGYRRWAAAMAAALEPLDANAAAREA